MSKEKERKIYKMFSKIICVSNDSKESVVNMYPEYKNKCQVIYNPIDKDEILNKSLKNIEKFDDKKINLITIGRLSYQKGYDILLESCKLLKLENIDFKLRILGEGDLKAQLQNFIDKNDLNENIELMGFKENPYPYIKNSDIYILSSRYEGYPLVLCETLILEKPIISTKCTGPSELLENGEYGVMVEIENSLKLAKNIKEMILNKQKRDKYKNLSKKRSEILNN